MNHLVTIIYFKFAQVAFLNSQKYNTAMLSKKLFRFINALALFAIIFASLAPSISHALITQNSENSFAQEICNSTGDKIVIQVVTTKGKQIVAEFVADKTSPKTIIMHMEHCPFCSNSYAAIQLPTSNAQMIAILEKTAHQTAQFSAPITKSPAYKSPPSQAPPSTL